MGNVLFMEDFSGDLSNWWVEGGHDVRIEDGRLHMDSDSVEQKYRCTVWCRQRFEGDIRIECDAHIVRSTKNSNNINFFFHYSRPDGKSLYETRDERPEANYRKYHEFSGNIVTFLPDPREPVRELPPEEKVARIRIRHCPGFKLLNEAFTYHCRKHTTYHIEIIRQGATIRFLVDGKERCVAEDPEAPSGGLVGLRTNSTYLWWDNIKVTQLPPAPVPSEAESNSDAVTREK